MIYQKSHRFLPSFATTVRKNQNISQQQLIFSLFRYFKDEISQTFRGEDYNYLQQSFINLRNRYICFIYRFKTSAFYSRIKNKYKFSQMHNLQIGTVKINFLIKQPFKAQKPSQSQLLIDIKRKNIYKFQSRYSLQKFYIKLQELVKIYHQESQWDQTLSEKYFCKNILMFFSFLFFQYLSQCFYWIIQQKIQYIMFQNLFQEHGQVPILQGRIQSIFSGNERKKPHDKNLYNKNRKQYYWNDFQKKRYILFVKESIKLFQLSVQERKILKLNILMSQKVKTRNPSQCHTHHQKMIRKYDNIEGIIENHLHLFNDYEKLDIKNTLKENFGEKKSIDQILSYSAKLSMGTNLISLEENDLLFKSFEDIDHFPLSSSYLLSSSQFKYEESFGLDQLL